MRTTLVIDDALLRRAKEHAARRGLTLSALVEQALRDELRSASAAREAGPRYRIQTFGDEASPRHHEPDELASALLQEDEESLGRGGPR